MSDMSWVIALIAFICGCVFTAVLRLVLDMIDDTGVRNMLESYNGGYTKALLDVLRWFEEHDDYLKWYRCYNSKSVLSILRSLVECRAELRDTGGCKSLVLNEETKEFRPRKEGEVFMRKKPV